MQTENKAAPKSKTSKRLKRLALCVLAAALLYFIAFAAAVHVTGLQDTAEPADVIIVLGAGLKEDGRPGPALSRRTRHAAALWHEGLAPLVLCAGGQSEYYPRAEAAACREILLATGLPDEAILLEERSRSTEENAIYSKRLLDSLGLTRVTLVSDSYHMLRAGWLFSARGIKTSASPVPASRIRGRLGYPYSLAREFLAFNWQVFKQAFNIPLTHIHGI